MEISKRQELFENPTKEYRGKPFWSWNGKLEKGELLRQIDIMKKMGFGGSFMHSRTGLETEYLGKEWFDLTNECADYAEKADMESWLYDEDRWPSGTAGGIVTKEERYRSMFLEMDQYSMEEFEQADWTKQIVAAYACKLDGVSYYGERVIKKGDTITEGETVILFSIRYSECKDVYNGYAYLDTMNREGVDRYIEVTHEAYKRECGDRIGTSIKGIFTDEPHRGALFSTFSEGRENAVPYTPVLFAEFEKRFGYDLSGCLMELFLLKGKEKVSKTTRDYLELCQELFIENFAVPIRDWCHENGMIFTGHVLHEDSLSNQTVMQGSLMRFYEYMDYPGVDVLTEGNECWWLVKQIASVARQLNKEWVLSELYGATGWQTSFESYKQVGDWQALFGINLRCPHLSWYTMKGEAKRDYPASMLHQSAWYEEFSYVEDYFSRIHAIFKDGRPVCDLLVVNPIESVWARAYSTSFQGLDAKDPEIVRLENQYKEVFYSLIQSRIDFDYGEEDIMAWHGRVQDGILYIGECAYKKVLVAGVDIMRTSTLELLKEFVKQGGEVIFAGEIPAYVDALPSKKVKTLAKDALRIPFTKEAIAKYCSSGTEVTVSGDANKEIFAQVSRNGNDRIIMLLNINRDKGFNKVEICLGEGANAELWDAKSGKQLRPKQIRKNGKIYIQTDFAKGEEKLYVITNEKRALPVSGTEKHMKIKNLPTEYNYELSEKNVCVLDMVQMITEQGEIIGRQEVLKADRALRDLLDIPYRGGEMLQPWYEVKFKGASKGALRRLHLTYDIEIAVLPKGVELVLEDMEHVLGIEVNGEKIENKSVGKWIDICFDRFVIPDEYLMIGKNLITIQYDYYKTCGIEAAYLLGDFGVTLKEEGKKTTLTSLPKTLKIGDITSQGLAFYSGKVTYELRGLEDKKVEVHAEGFEGSCLKLLGEDQETMIAFAPYKGEVRGLKGIQVILTRRSTFGPLHQLPAKAFAYSPENFVTAGEEWSDAYVFLPQGLMKEPEIFEIKDAE